MFFLEVPQTGVTHKHLPRAWTLYNLVSIKGVLHSFSTKNIIYDKMDLRGFLYFHVTI